MTMDRKTTLYILRHGETTWNDQRRVQGMQGTDLNEKGIALARITAEALRSVPFDLCFSSPLMPSSSFSSPQRCSASRSLPSFFST